MKIRTGFVSNSSSSSFCCVGSWIPDEDIEKLITTYWGDKYKEGAEKGHWIIDGNPENWCYNEGVFEEELGLELFGGDDWETGTSLGLGIQDMEDDETMGAFKKRISEKLQKIGITRPPTIITDGSYFG
jgi:hypothetical protein